MTHIEVRESGHGCFHYVYLTRITREAHRAPTFVFTIDEAPDLVHQLQTIIRAHTIQQ